MKNFAEKYFLDGLLKVPSLITVSDINKIRNEVNKISKLNIGKKIFEKDEVTLRSIMSYHNKNEILNYFTCYKPVLDIVSKLIGNKFYVSQSKINTKCPNDLGKKWDYHRGFTFWHLLDGKPNQEMVSVFICLTKQKESNGAVMALLKSHQDFDIDLMKKESEITKNNFKRDTSENLSIQIKEQFVEEYLEKFKLEYLTGNQGDVFFMHPGLIHASSNNKSSESRDLMITVYNSTSNLPRNFTRPEYLCERDTTVLVGKEMPEGNNGAC